MKTNTNNDASTQPSLVSAAAIDQTAIASSLHSGNFTDFNRRHEDYCVHIIVSIAFPTSHLYNEPHERAVACLAGEITPIHLDKEVFIERGMNHANYIRSLTEAELRQPLANVEKKIEDADQAYKLKSDIEKNADASDDSDLADSLDEEEMLWFETNVFDAIKVMQAYFINADPVILRKKLGEKWDKSQQRNINYASSKR